MNYESIRSVMSQSGFIKSRETKKLEEFQFVGNDVVYLYEDQALNGAVQVVVHHRLQRPYSPDSRGLPPIKGFLTAAEAT